MKDNAKKTTMKEKNIQELIQAAKVALTDLQEGLAKLTELVGVVDETYLFSVETIPTNKSTFKDGLVGFPEEVVEKMLEKQVEQGNVRDVSVFEGLNQIGAAGGGFDWEETIEGFPFWESVIAKGGFDIFFEKYPKDGSLCPKDGSLCPKELTIGK